MSEIKAKDVELFVRDLIESGGIYDVDKDGYIVKRTNNDEPYLVKAGNQYKRLMVIKEMIIDKDTLIINPLNENDMESHDAKWLYIMLNSGITWRIIELAKYLTTVIEIEKEKDKHPEINFPIDVIEFASRHKEFDAKVLEYFLTISKKPLNFISVWYNRKMKEACFRCSVYDPDTIAEFPQITKKAWKVITHFMSDILGISTNNEQVLKDIKNKFNTRSDLITVPKLESMLNVYYKLYTQLNPYLSLNETEDDRYVVDLTTLGSHINNLSEYYSKAKWFVTSSSLPDKPQMRTVDGNIPQPVVSNIPSNPAIAQYTPGYVEPESNIPSNPLRANTIPLEYAQPRPMTTFRQPQFSVQQPQFGGFQQTQPFVQRPGIIPSY